ncbi:MAG: hypothetical protein HY303_18965 [Candidatus Wallbacteria bacterium]|nr:hypothetical protein [Candidatus Wallbacteria bacterium]
MAKLILLIALSFSVAAVSSVAQDAASSARTWTFDAEMPGSQPSGFTFERTGDGSQGNWVVKKDETAPSPGNVLAQLDADDTDYRFPVAVAVAPVLKNLELSVRFKPVSGKVDRGAGLVFRYKDAGNYYVVRANALEDNINLYHVVGGKRRQFAGWSGKVSSGVWHTLAATARGNHFEASFDGKKIIGADDETFSDAGKVGLWTKADSVIHFDDLTVRPLSR